MLVATTQPRFMLAGFICWLVSNFILMRKVRDKPHLMYMYWFYTAATLLGIVNCMKHILAV